MHQQKWIVFTGGGTGGHVFPGLAVIDELNKMGWQRLAWIGSGSGMEGAVIRNEGIPFYRIPSGKMRRYFSFQNFLDLFKITAGFFISLLILIRLKPRLLFSKGGYVTVPPVLAAFLLRIPVITHESDYDPGMATRINARFAGKILTSFPATVTYFKGPAAEKVICTGNPVRSLFFRGDSARGKALVGCPPEKPLLLVLGGSQGSAAINSAVLNVLDQLTGKCFIVHQMGKKGYQPLRKPGYYPAPFFGEELADILAAAQLVICRSGSNTLWELAAAAVPSILVPLPAATSRGDQIRNAGYFREKGAAEVIEEADLETRLLEILLKLINNKNKLTGMQSSLKALSNKNAAVDIAVIIIKEIEHGN